MHHRCLAPGIRYAPFCGNDTRLFSISPNAARYRHSRRVGQFKSFTARTIIDAMKKMNHQTMLQELEFFKKRHKIDQQFQLWQESSHPQVVLECEELWWLSGINRYLQPMELKVIRRSRWYSRFHGRAMEPERSATWLPFSCTCPINYFDWQLHCATLPISR